MSEGGLSDRNSPKAIFAGGIQMSSCDYYYYIHSYIVLIEFYTIIWYAYLLKCLTLKYY